MYHACQSTALSFALSLISSRVGDVDRWSLGAPRGLSIAHPFLDTRVLRYGLGMQARLSADPHGQKPVLARAMRDVLPERILERRLKCDFSPIKYLGLARNQAALEALVREAPVDDLGLIDKEALLGCLRQAALGVASRMGGLSRLDLALSFLLWFSRQRAWSRVGMPSAVLRPGQTGGVHHVLHG
jgi:asparagine synthase (glutamine-hydrolysing)